MYRRAGTIIILIFSLLVISCAGTETDHAGKTVFRYNESKGITTLDPAFARNQTIIWPVSQLFNGLVQLNDSLRVEPCIAHSWEIENNGTLYRFHLRRDVLFHSSPLLNAGQRRVTAHDFVYSFSRILDPEVASPGSWIFDYLDPGKMFRAEDDSTLLVYLKEPFPPFLSILAMPYCSVVPEEVVENTGTDFAHAPIGTGPFRFQHWSADEKLVLLKNTEYFEQDDVGVQLPYMDAVSITFIKDKQSEFLEFLKGNLDFLSGVHIAYKDELLTGSGKLNPAYADRFRLLTEPYLNTEYLGILQEDLNGEPHVLQDRLLRQAINYGFDRNKMMLYLRNNLGYPANAGMIPPGLAGHLEQGEGYVFNPDLAMELLRQAGYGGDIQPGPIVLTTTSDYLDLCEFIQFELNKIGIPVEINVSTGASFRNLVANGNLQFFRGSWIADYADAENYLALFYTPNRTPDGPNYSRFSSVEFDRLYKTAIGEPNEEDRIELYRKMDSLVMAESPVIPLFYDMVVRFAPLNIEGFSPNPMNNLVLKFVRKTN